MSNIALIGPGAIGGLAATWLCQDPAHHVTVCARTAFRHLDMETPYGRLQGFPDVLTTPGGQVPADWVLVATKAYDSAAAAAWFTGLLNAGTHVAVLQNGVDHVERFARYLPAERILPVIVDCPAERTAPGALRQRGEATLVVPRSPLGARFCTLFDNTRIAASQDPDFISAAWRKLCINAAGVVNGLTGQPAGVANDEQAAGLMRRIVEETAMVGRAVGASLPTGMADEVVEMYRSQPVDSVNSLLADRLAGRQTEIEVRNGVVVGLGREHGIPTPCNEMAVALMKVAWKP